MTSVWGNVDSLQGHANLDPPNKPLFHHNATPYQRQHPTIPILMQLLYALQLLCPHDNHAKLSRDRNARTISFGGLSPMASIVADGACSEADLPERLRLHALQSLGISIPVLKESCAVDGKLIAELAVGKRVGLSLIRCGDVCSPPEALPGARVCYRAMTDRVAKLLWADMPRTVLIVKKWKDAKVREFAFEIAAWLVEHKGVRVYIASEGVLPDGVLQYTPENAEEIDFIVTIGGDGTVLYTASLFQGPCPPILSISYGSLGFLTATEPSEARVMIESVLNAHTEPVDMSPRTRLQVTVHRGGSTTPESTFVGLNELIVERGPSPYMTALDAYLDGEYLTVVQADGILCATPTGSTAYSLSAGGSILFPTVPALLFTPICPHSLSFRPIMFPDSSVITLKIPPTTRGERVDVVVLVHVVGVDGW
jgi:NAD kinase